MIPAPRRWFASVAMTLALVSCQGRDAPASQREGPPSERARPRAANQTHTCVLVTRAAVQAAFGGATTDGVPGKTPQYCDFKLTGVPGAKGDVTLGVHWDEYVIAADDKLYARVAQRVPELGAAWYTKSQAFTGGVLDVAAQGGELEYQLVGGDLPDATVRAALVALAKATSGAP
jgi:hypothetical protein